MSRLTEIKKQYPELNITVIDIFNMIDKSKTYKYLPLLCKIFGKQFSNKSKHGQHLNEVIKEQKEYVLEFGISPDDLTENELFTMVRFLGDFNDNDFKVFNQFINYINKDLILNKDVTSYSSIDDIRGAVTLATLKEDEKMLEGQVIREYEDDTWLAVRPLTFNSSAKYGSNTKWCTTFSREKSYFEKYWRSGILIYFINKKTGYKFASYKSLLDYDKELSFWNQEDSRTDYLDIEIDDYMFPIVKNMLKSTNTNKSLCDESIVKQVETECGYNVKKLSASIDLAEMPQPYGQQEPTPRYNHAIRRMANEISENVDREIVGRLIGAATAQFHQETLEGINVLLQQIDNNVLPTDTIPTDTIPTDTIPTMRA